jgi:hypothetical protein
MIARADSQSPDARDELAVFLKRLVEPAIRCLSAWEQDHRSGGTTDSLVIGVHFVNVLRLGVVIGGYGILAVEVAR